MGSLLSNILGSVSEEISSTTDKYKEYVGKYIVIEKDTTLIVDYSILESNLNLNNGNVISFELAEKSIILIEK